MCLFVGRAANLYGAPRGCNSYRLTAPSGVFRHAGASILVRAPFSFPGGPGRGPREFSPLRPAQSELARLLTGFTVVTKAAQGNTPTRRGRRARQRKHWDTSRHRVVHLGDVGAGLDHNRDFFRADGDFSAKLVEFRCSRRGAGSRVSVCFHYPHAAAHGRRRRSAPGRPTISSKLGRAQNNP